jgi:hypothetical protein
MEKSKGERQTYLAHLMTLAKDNCLGAFKEILKLRLSGDHEKSFCTEKYGEIISPPLTRDEYEENQLIVYAYNLLKENNKQKSIECLREVVVDLLIEALSDDEQEQQKQVSYIKELSYLMVSINVEEATELAEKVRTFVWSRLEQLDLFSDSSDDVRFGCAHRTFDVWLIVTPQTSCEETCKRKLQTLFQKNIQKNIVYPMQFKFLLLMFRAVVKFDRYFAGRIAFFALSQKIERENQERLIRSFSNLCWELGILIKQPVEELESFLQGLAAVPKPDRDTMLASPIFIQALSRMELPESQLPSDIAFVLAFNRIANQFISQEQNKKKIEGIKQELETLNRQNIILSMLSTLRDMENFIEDFIGYFIEDKLEPFIKAIFSQNFSELKLFLIKIQSEKDGYGKYSMLCGQWRIYASRVLQDIVDKQKNEISKLLASEEISGDALSYVVKLLTTHQEIRYFVVERHFLTKEKCEQIRHEVEKTGKTDNFPYGLCDKLHSSSDSHQLTAA